MLSYSAFLSPELGGLQTVDRRYHFEGMLLQNLENNHPENGTRYFEEIRRTCMNLSFKFVHSVYELTGLASSDKWKALLDPAGTKPGNIFTETCFLMR